MYVAKVNKTTKIVENIELAYDQEWVDQNSKGDYVYIEYTLDNPAVIGLSWSKENGFEQPPKSPESLKDSE